MAIRAPFQINSGTRGSSAVRVLPSASGRVRSYCLGGIGEASSSRRKKLSISAVGLLRRRAASCLSASTCFEDLEGVDDFDGRAIRQELSSTVDQQMRRNL